MTLSNIAHLLVVAAGFLMIVSTIQMFRDKRFSSSLCCSVGLWFLVIAQVIHLVGGVK